MVAPILCDAGVATHHFCIDMAYHGLAHASLDILAEGAIALSVTLSGGALFAS